MLVFHQFGACLVVHSLERAPRVPVYIFPEEPLLRSWRLEFCHLRGGGAFTIYLILYERLAPSSIEGIAVANPARLALLDDDFAVTLDTLVSDHQVL